MSSAPQTPLLEVTGFCLQLPHGRVLANSVSLTLARGAHIALLGANGAGKTCLLDALATDPHVTRRGKVARVYQDLRLVRQKTVRENIRHGQWAVSEQAETRVETLLTQLGLLSVADHCVYTLSGGEAQRTALGRALASAPDILLLDEVFSAQDPAMRDAIASVLHAHTARGGAIISVVHQASLASLLEATPMTLRAQGLLQGIHPALEAEEKTSHPSPDIAGAGAIGWPWILGLAVAWVLAAGSLWPEFQSLHAPFSQAGQFLAQLWPGAQDLRDLSPALLWQSWRDTLAMTLCATLLSVVVALPLAACAARNLAPGWCVVPLRLWLNVWRAVPSLVWGLLAVAAVGLGTAAGVLALLAYSLGYLTKFYYEAFEQVDMRPAHALRALGANRWQWWREAVWPAALPPFFSATLFMLEYNLRAASVLGLVGAGGLGYLLKNAAEWGNWGSVGLILALLAATVIGFDTLSARLRMQLTRERL